MVLIGKSLEEQQCPWSHCCLYVNNISLLREPDASFEPEDLEEELGKTRDSSSSEEELRSTDDILKQPGPEEQEREKEKERSVQAAMKKDEKRTLEHEAVIAKIKAGTEKDRRSLEEFKQRQSYNEKMRKQIEADLDKYDVKKIIKKNPHFLDEVERYSRRHYHYKNGTSSEREHLQNNNKEKEKEKRKQEEEKEKAEKER